jgi:hypothetical protein
MWSEVPLPRASPTADHRNLHFAICNLQFAICNLQFLIRRELFSRIRVIRAIGPRRRLLFGGQPKALPPAAPQHAPLPRSPSATSRLLKKSDAPCPLGAELSAIGLPPAIPRAPGALTPRGFGTCQLPARTKQSRWPSPETSFLRVRSEAARLTAGCRGVVFAGRPCHGTCSRGGPKPSGACFGLGTCASKATREGSAAGVVKRSGSSQVVQPRGTSPRGVRLFQQSPRAGGSETDQLPASRKHSPGRALRRCSCEPVPRPPRSPLDFGASHSRAAPCRRSSSPRRPEAERGTVRPRNVPCERNPRGLGRQTWLSLL